MELKSENSKSEYIKLTLVLLVIFGILGGFLLYLSIPLLSTHSVILATEPVDPFDIFRGQYLTIRYEIGTIPSIDGASVGDDVYVTLKEDMNGTSQYKEASLEKPPKDIIIPNPNTLPSISFLLR